MAKGKAKTSGKKQGIDERILKALAHPLRVQILAALEDRPAAPVELSQAIGVPLSNVSYHMRELAKFECIEEIKTEQIRGSVKHTYRATTRMMLDDSAWKKIPEAVRHGISLVAVRESIERVSAAIEADTFDKRDDRHVINLKLDLTEQGWTEVAEVIADTYERLEQIKANEGGAEGKKMRATVSMLSYESP